MSKESKALYALAVLLAINTMNFYDRTALGAVAEPIREEWQLSDKSLGLLGTAFILLYAMVGVPLGRLADRYPRTRLLAVGVFVWSLLTGVSGFCRTYSQLFLARLGVGVGEAVCAPAASSLIGDLFSAQTRGRALAVFMMGLPIGNALSFFVSGLITQNYSWRAAFLVAAVPGVLCAAAALFVHEPARGATEAHGVGERRRAGSPYRLVLSIPTIWWIIASGALHNFNMYAIGTFLSPLLMRVHGLSVVEASNRVTLIYGLSGLPALILGGVLGDAMRRRQVNGRLLVGGVALGISVPLIYFGLGRPVGDVGSLVLLLSLGCGVMYVYYSTVYATVQDVIEPSLRATAMALYFFAMYILGAALGPYATGVLSDHYIVQAAQADGVALDGLAEADYRKALDPYRGAGLHRAMYVIPILNLLLCLVLFAGATTVRRDVQRLQDWMKSSDG